MAAVAEEELIRKRLAVEGDSGGDDRRIMSQLKSFVRWCNNSQLTKEECDSTYQKMLFSLGRFLLKAHHHVVVVSALFLKHEVDPLLQL